MTSSRNDSDVKYFFLQNLNDSANNYLEDLWSEIVITFLRKRQAIEYKTQLAAKASIPEYIYHGNLS